MNRSKMCTIALTLLLVSILILTACDSSQISPAAGGVDKDTAFRVTLRTTDGQQEELDQVIRARVDAFPKDWLAYEDEADGIVIYVDRTAGMLSHPASMVSDLLTCPFRAGIARDMVPLVGLDAEKLQVIAIEPNEKGTMELILTYEEGYLETVWEELETEENIVSFMAFLRNGLQKAFFEYFDRTGDVITIHSTQPPEMGDFFSYLLKHEDGFKEKVSVTCDGPVEWEDPAEYAAESNHTEGTNAEAGQPAGAKDEVAAIDPRLNPTHVPGAHQVAAEELRDHCHRIYYSSYRRSTFDERDTLYGCIQERLEQLEIPYALGRDADERLVLAYSDPEGSSEEEKELLLALLLEVGAKSPSYQLLSGDERFSGYIQLVDVEDDSITLYPDEKYYDEVRTYLKEHPTEEILLTLGNVGYLGWTKPIASITYEDVKDRADLKFTNLYYKDPKFLAYLRTFGTWDLSYTMEADFLGQD